MVIAFYLLALAMVLGGAASIYQGTLIFAFSSGATLVTAGVAAATGGCLLAGIAALLGTLRRVEGALTSLFEGGTSDRDGRVPVEAEPGRRDEPRAVLAAAPLPEPTVEADPVRPPAGDAAAARPDGLRGTLPAPEPPPAERSVAGTYSSGSNSYVMYSDGSIQADTPNGRFHFDTADELKDFIAKGGEKKQ